jgi:hypothetical protein
MDGHEFGALAQPERGEETGYAEHVVEVTVRQQQSI